jgi:hypothetical protein
VHSTPQGTGIDCLPGGTAGCSLNAPAGSVWNLIASPNPGASFVGFSGDCMQSGMFINTTTLTMTGPRTCTATFGAVQTFPLTVNVTGSGRVNATPAGIASCGAPTGEDCTENYPSGMAVTLSATPGVTGSTFAGWSGACSGTAATTTVTVNQAATCTASFTGNVQIDFNIVGNGNVTNGNPPLSCSTGNVGTCSLVEPVNAMDTVNASAVATWSGICATPTAQNARTIAFPRDGVCTVTFP